MAKINIIAALGKGRAIGYKNDLLWKIPADLKRFKALTTGHPIVMGRKTFESIGRALPGRINIVVTRNTDWRFEGTVVTESLEQALEKAAEANDEIFIIGGGEIYAQALPRADRLYLTLIEDEKEGDIFFPEYERDFTKMTYHEDLEHDGLKYKWITLEK